MDATIKALAEIVNAPQTEHQFDDDVISRSFVIDRVTTIKHDCDTKNATIASLTAEVETLCNVIDGHAVHVAVEAQAAHARQAIVGAKP